MYNSHAFGKTISFSFIGNERTWKILRALRKLSYFYEQMTERKYHGRTRNSVRLNHSLKLDRKAFLSVKIQVLKVLRLSFKLYLFSSTSCYCHGRQCEALSCNEVKRNDRKRSCEDIKPEKVIKYLLTVTLLS